MQNACTPLDVVAGRYRELYFKCERDYLLRNTPWLAGFLSLIGLLKQLKNLFPYLIGLSYLS